MTMNMITMRYCHQIQISNEKVKREGGGRQDRRKISPLLVPLTYIHVRSNSLHIVYTEFNLIHAVECSSFPTSLFTDNGVAATFGRGARNLFSLAPTKILNMSCHMEPSYPRTCEEPKRKTVAHQIKPSSCKSVHIHTVHCVRFVTFSACWLHSSVFVYDNHMF